MVSRLISRNLWLRYALSGAANSRHGGSATHLRRQLFATTGGKLGDTWIDRLAGRGTVRNSAAPDFETALNP